MNVLLLGSGGREHAMAWKISQSKLCSKLFIAPGNAGTRSCGTNIEMAPTDFDSIKKFCTDKKIDMVIVGPEEPLVNGIVDFFANDKSVSHIPVIGPSANGAQLEGSKAYSKKFMQRYKIPTAAYREFDLDNYEEGIAYLKDHPLPIVLKADGLAAGKGVVICQSRVEAMAEYELMLQHNKFGKAGKKIVVEEFLKGVELSMFVLTDGNHFVILPEAKDYKRIGEGDRGPNTGGMGAVSPVPFADKRFINKVESTIIKPTIEGLKKENIKYKGFIFIGLMVVGEDPYVIEYNCRLGDPETEVVIPRLKNDLLELFVAVAEEELDKVTIEQESRVASTIMCVSGGYPGSYEKGFEIKGLNKEYPSGSFVFQAGTKTEGDKILTNGGRVLCVTSFGDTVHEAVDKSREVLQEIDFDGMYYRRDIGYEFMS
ncbi:MAG: phosphoribosylamine--glycine ligase [Bacteroidetes bacterium]|nr:MAG: phosphoribosylamine--glycine ligase [Bacteroidota bacterium]